MSASRRIHRRTAGLIVGALLVALLAPRAATASPRKPSVAVLEFRQGVSALPWFADRMAKRLRFLTGFKVLGPTEARQKLGDRVDNFVARCQGQPRCVGALGVKLGVTEVILIGMSSLGDVIFQITRVRASTRRVLGSVGHTLSPGAKLTNQIIDSLLRRLMPRKYFIRYGYIKVNSNRGGAAVYLNTKRRGTTPLRGPLKVHAPSANTIKVTKKGFVDFNAHLKVPPDATVTVNAVLPPIPKGGGTPVYRRWWFWTVLATGVVAIAGMATGVALTVGKPPRNVPAVIRW